MPSEPLDVARGGFESPLNGMTLAEMRAVSKRERALWSDRDEARSDAQREWEGAAFQLSILFPALLDAVAALTARAEAAERHVGEEREKAEQLSGKLVESEMLVQALREGVIEVVERLRDGEYPSRESHRWFANLADELAALVRPTHDQEGK